MMGDKKNVHQRLADVMGEVSYIQREEKKGMSYKIVSHDKVTALVRPALLKHGIVYYPVRCDHQHNGNRAECAMTVRFVNVDEPTDFFDVPTFGYGIDPQDKGPGKAMSYAVKYALLKALGLETGDDPDMESVDHSAVDPALPRFDAKAAAERIKGIVAKKKSAEELDEYWASSTDDRREIYDAAPTLHETVKAAFSARKAQLTEQKDQAA